MVTPNPLRTRKLPDVPKWALDGWRRKVGVSFLLLAVPKPPLLSVHFLEWPGPTQTDLFLKWLTVGTSPPAAGVQAGPLASWRLSDNVPTLCTLPSQLSPQVTPLWDAVHPGEVRLSPVQSNFFSGSSHSGLNRCPAHCLLRSPGCSKNGHAQSTDKKTEARRN